MRVCPRCTADGSPSPSNHSSRSRIHGYPWDGLNVQVYFQQMSKDSFCKCLIPEVAKIFKLGVIEGQNNTFIYHSFYNSIAVYLHLLFIQYISIAKNNNIIIPPKRFY